MRHAPALQALGEDDRQLSGSQGGGPTFDVEGAGKSDHTRKASEVALDQVIGVGKRGGGDTGRVHGQLDRLVGLDDVGERPAGAGGLCRSGRPSRGKLVEKLANIVAELPPLGRLDKRKVSHSQASSQGIEAEIQGQYMSN